MKRKTYEVPVFVRFEPDDYHNSAFLWAALLRRLGLEDNPGDVACVRVRTNEIEVWYNKDDLGG